MKNKDKSLELRDYFYLFLILKNILVYFYFISIQASIRNAKSLEIHPRFEKILKTPKVEKL